MTFDLSTGRQLELKDVMNLPEDRILELAARRLKEEQAICKNTNRRPYIMEDFTLEYYHNRNGLWIRKESISILMYMKLHLIRKDLLIFC